LTGAELEVITAGGDCNPGPEVNRLATLHANADHQLLAVWLKNHADGSPHTMRVYQRLGERFLGALAAATGCTSTPRRSSSSIRRRAKSRSASSARWRRPC